MRILILGGYGVFGGRLAELLADEPGLELLIAGRHRDKAAAFCAGYRGATQVRPVALDRRDIRTALRDHAPDLVVDASGPFQDYGTACYDVIEACIAAGIDYLDFADAAEFVAGVARFDDQARAAGSFVLSGASSFPVLTGAVLREVSKTMTVRTVTAGIAPSPYAGVGLNVMRAVVGYAGAPVALLRGGRPAHGVGLAESRRYTVAVPGRVPLRNLHYSLVDVPDLRVIPPDYPAMTDIWMGAAPVPETLHRLLNLLARARWRLRLPSLTPFSRLFYAVLNRMRFGEHRGGMFVHVGGTAEGVPVERSWHLLAEGDDGPYIPSMAIAGIVRKLRAGERPATGARPAAHALDLSDYERLFHGRSIFTGFREDDASAPLYPRLLGSAFAALPPAVRALHKPAATRRWIGFADVRRGTGPAARLVARLIGFPRTATGVPVAVTLTPEHGGERWVRDFGGRYFSSLQFAGRGRNERLLVERFGAIDVALALVVRDGRLQLVPRRWSLLGIPLPRFLLPGDASFESERDGRFHFDVTIAIPFVGLIVAYAGTLTPATRDRADESRA